MVILWAAALLAPTPAPTPEEGAASGSSTFVLAVLGLAVAATGVWLTWRTTRRKRAARGLDGVTSDLETVYDGLRFVRDGAMLREALWSDHYSDAHRRLLSASATVGDFVLRRRLKSACTWFAAARGVGPGGERDVEGVRLPQGRPADASYAALQALKRARKLRRRSSD